jgi:PREDICTED: exosome component 5-like, partial
MANKLRELVIEYNNLSNPDGSAILCQGNTVVQASVYGPVEIPTAREKCEKALLNVSFKTRSSSTKCKLFVG